MCTDISNWPVVTTRWDYDEVGLFHLSKLHSGFHTGFFGVCVEGGGVVCGALPQHHAGV